MTWEHFQNAKKRQTADAPLSETERLLKETALLERDTNVRSTAMGVIPFEISQNVRDKLTLLKNGEFDWITMVCESFYMYFLERKTNYSLILFIKKLNTEDESVTVVKSLETVDLTNVKDAIDHKVPSFVAYRYRGALVAAPTLSTFQFVAGLKAL